jgi:oligoribonuclease
VVDQQTTRLIWIDLEMTGLDPVTNTIIEIATVITNADLEVLAEGPVLAIAQDVATLEGMDEWNTQTHTASGLVRRIREEGVSLAEAELQTLHFLSEWIKPGISPMCGNSICQDRRFLAREMPELCQYFHYRNLDVSSIKELAARWKPELLASFTKETAHTALADVMESIDELKFYRQNFFVA